MTGEYTYDEYTLARSKRAQSTSQKTPRVETGPGVVGGISALLAAAGLTLLVPAVVLLVGAPLALAVRAVVEALGWLLGWV